MRVIRSSLVAIAAAAGVVLAAGCVPADEALPLGGAQFNVSARGSARVLGDDVFIDDWSVRIDRFLLSFKTMTIVNLQDDEQCAYRGRGGPANVVFDGANGTLMQSFNGLKPGDCPDVGMRLRPPDNLTTLGEGATTADLVDLASGRPAHALLEATATRKAELPFRPEAQTVRLRLRFDTERTSAGFGGCRDAIRGARIRPEARYNVAVSIAAEALFRDAISSSARLQFEPFAAADRNGDEDGLITMDELDRVSLVEIRSRYGPFYQLPTGSSRGTFGDFVRAQFMFSLRYGNGGLCNGINPGEEDDD